MSLLTGDTFGSFFPVLRPFCKLPGQTSTAKAQSICFYSCPLTDPRAPLAPSLSSRFIIGRLRHFTGKHSRGYYENVHHKMCISERCTTCGVLLFFAWGSSPDSVYDWLVICLKSRSFSRFGCLFESQSSRAKETNSMKFFIVET